MAKIELSAERRKWPYEAYVVCADGSRLFSAYARPNPDGTISVATFEPPEGFIETSYPAEQVTIRLSVELRKLRWLILYAEVYGDRRDGDT